jgi:hypothetical protein
VTVKLPQFDYSTIGGRQYQFIAVGDFPIGIAEKKHDSHTQEKEEAGQIGEGDIYIPVEKQHEENGDQEKR